MWRVQPEPAGAQAPAYVMLPTGMGQFHPAYATYSMPPSVSGAAHLAAYPTGMPFPSWRPDAHGGAAPRSVPASVPAGAWASSGPAFNDDVPAKRSRGAVGPSGGGFSAQPGRASTSTSATAAAAVAAAAGEDSAKAEAAAALRSMADPSRMTAPPRAPRPADPSAGDRQARCGEASNGSPPGAVPPLAGTGPSRMGQVAFHPPPRFVMDGAAASRFEAARMASYMAPHGGTWLPAFPPPGAGGVAAPGYPGGYPLYRPMIPPGAFGPGALDGGAAGGGGGGAGGSGGRSGAGLSAPDRGGPPAPPRFAPDMLHMGMPHYYGQRAMPLEYAPGLGPMMVSAAGGQVFMPGLRVGDGQQAFQPMRFAPTDDAPLRAHAHAGSGGFGVDYGAHHGFARAYMKAERAGGPANGEPGVVEGGGAASKGYRSDPRHQGLRPPQQQQQQQQQQHRQHHAVRGHPQPRGRHKQQQQQQQQQQAGLPVHAEGSPMSTPLLAASAAMRAASIDEEGDDEDDADDDFGLAGGKALARCASQEAAEVARRRMRRMESNRVSAQRSRERVLHLVLTAERNLHAKQVLLSVDAALCVLGPHGEIMFATPGPAPLGDIAAEGNDVRLASLVASDAARAELLDWLARTRCLCRMAAMLRDLLQAGLGRDLTPAERARVQWEVHAWQCASLRTAAAGGGAGSAAAVGPQAGVPAPPPWPVAEALAADGPFGWAPAMVLELALPSTAAPTGRPSAVTIELSGVARDAQAYDRGFITWLLASGVDLRREAFARRRERRIAEQSRAAELERAGLLSHAAAQLARGADYGADDGDEDDDAARPGSPSAVPVPHAPAALRLPHPDAAVRERRDRSPTRARHQPSAPSPSSASTVGSGSGAASFQPSAAATTAASAAEHARDLTPPPGSEDRIRGADGFRLLDDDALRRVFELASRPGDPRLAAVHHVLTLRVL